MRPGRCALPIVWFAALVLGACDLDTLAFRVPPKIYRFNTAHLLWVQEARLPESACEEAVECCAALSRLVKDCQTVTLQCPQQRCGMSITVERAVPVTLARDVPDLALLGEGSLSRLRITKLETRWEAPPPPDLGAEIELFMAATFSTDGQPIRRQRLGSVSIPSARRGGKPTVTFAPMGQALFGSFARMANEPFWLIAVARVPMAAGDTVPTGDFALALELELATSLGL